MNIYIKKQLSRLFYHFEYEIISVDPSRYRPRYSLINIPAVESKQIGKILLEFSEEMARDPTFRFKALKNYLSDDRVYFFFELMALCREYEIEMDDQSVADIGSGMGYILRCIKNEYTPESLTGYDTFEQMLPLSRKFCKEATFQPTGLFEMEATYDIIFCTEVIEHLVHPCRAVKKLFGMLNPGGTLINTIPDGRKDTLPAIKIRADGTAYWDILFSGVQKIGLFSSRSNFLHPKKSKQDC
ncbi:MAG: methyltransferase domain-containing protein [Balneolaceae bacterium]|nr:methyltransferase domain-containing protein [Balneolaceae bacterium]